MLIITFKKQDWLSDDEVNLEKVPFLDNLSLSGHHILKTRSAENCKETS